MPFGYADSKARSTPTVVFKCLLKDPLPSTSEVSKVTFAALRLPAGKFSPIFSNFSLKDRPPFFDFALRKIDMRLNQVHKWNSNNFFSVYPHIQLPFIRSKLISPLLLWIFSISMFLVPPSFQPLSQLTFWYCVFFKHFPLYPLFYSPSLLSSNLNVSCGYFFSSLM